MKEYNTLFKEGIDEIIIEKSRFIGYGKGVESEEQAQTFIQDIKKKHYDATHNVWAYCLGESMNIQRYSDDGEPSGTAGIPTLEVLKKEGITNAVLVITRYFGGIKLGAGGLVRAYTKGATLAVQSSQISKKVIFVPLTMTIDYGLLGKFENDISNKNLPKKPWIFTDVVKMKIFVPQQEIDNYKEHFVNLAVGNVSFEQEEKVYLDFVDGRIIQ